MRKNLVFDIAYFLVTRGFTLMILWLVFVVVLVIIESPIRTSATEVKVNLHQDRNAGLITLILEKDAHTDFDTLAHASHIASVNDAVAYLPLSSLKKSSFVPYYFLKYRGIFVIAAWAYILYQLFLILYDIKSQQYFVLKNVSRMRNMGIAIIILGLIDGIDFRFHAFVNSRYDLIFGDYRTQYGFGDMWTYLTFGFVVIVLASVFQRGNDLQKDSELTI